MPSKITSPNDFLNEDHRHICSINPLGIIAATLFTVLFTVGILFGNKIG
jgi:hypothetical protein